MTSLCTMALSRGHFGHSVTPQEYVALNLWSSAFSLRRSHGTGLVALGLAPYTATQVAPSKVHDFSADTGQGLGSASLLLASYSESLFGLAWHRTGGHLRLSVFQGMLGY